ncbi:MAG TPA: phosphatase PAP2 family protein [Acidimicrobiales bacterium]|nr:phosphatase PAP2 family protein [Acidimicrobiales bacterium]
MQSLERVEAAASLSRPRLWAQVAIIAVFYSVYSFTRNLFGSARLGDGEEPVDAFEHALRVIDIEQAMSLYRELDVQRWFLPGGTLRLGTWFIQFWNVFYGTAHFFVTIGAFIWIYVRGPGRFKYWRNVLGVTTAVGILGFALFPLMPPRLLNDTESEFGGGRLAIEQGVDPDEIAFVDTLAEYGGPWAFNTGPVKALSNQYAAMPSLHIAWAIWCTCVLWTLVNRRWVRVLLVLYPLATLFCIVVTANHYWLDGVGGVAALGIGVLVAEQVSRWNRRRRGQGLPEPIG